MEHQFVRKTFKEKLRPTPIQERVLDAVLQRCRTLYNAALEQRITAWQRGHVSISRFQQEAELKDLRAEMPEYEDIHSHLLQDVLARLDKTYQAFFRRLQRGEQAGFPRFKGRNRWHSFTFKEYGNGARLDNGSLLLSKIGRIAVHWSRPLEGTPKTVTIAKEADGWYVAFACAEVPIQPLPLTGQVTGIDLGIEAFATLADGTMLHHPRCYRRAERYLVKCQRRVSRRSKGSHRRRKAVVVLARAHQTVQRQRRDFHHKTALALVQQYDTLYHEDLRVANLVKNHHLAKSISDAGWSGFLTILAFKAASAGKQVQAATPRSRAKRAQAAGCWSRRAYPCGGTPAPHAGRACIGTTTRPETSNGAGSAFGDSRGCLRGGTENPPLFRASGVSDNVTNLRSGEGEKLPVGHERVCGAAFSRIITLKHPSGLKT
jgi:putative transposase